MKKNNSHPLLTQNAKINIPSLKIILILLFFGSSLSLFGQLAPNDCILDAIDLTPQINNAMIEPSGWDCNYDWNYFFGGATPTAVPSNNVPKTDIWFSFVADSSHTAWLTVYEAGVDVTIELYEETDTLDIDCSFQEAFVNGLTHIATAKENCDDGDPRNVGICTHSVHNRIDISNLNSNQTYYIRLTTDFAVSNGYVIVCAERNFIEAPEADRCPEINELIIGDGELTALPNTAEFGTPNINQTFTRINGNNAGAFGNAIDFNSCLPVFNCDSGNGAVQIGLGPTGERAYCDDSFFDEFINLAFNNIINNNIMYKFRVNALDCDAHLVLKFENVEVCCNGHLQLNVVKFDSNQNCDAQFNSLITDNLFTGDCFQYRPLNNTISNGDYIIRIDGQDGVLVKYDLEVSVTYENCSSTPCTEVPIATEAELDSCNDLGIATFNLSAANSIVNGGSNNIVRYYEDSEATTEITTTSSYTIMTSDAPVTIYATADSGNCESEPVSVILNVESTPIINNIIAVDSEDGLDNGSIEVTISNGTPPYTVIVNDTEIIGNGPIFNFTDLVPGFYTVTVKDNNGCTTMGNTDIMVGINRIDELIEMNIAPNPTQDIVTVKMKLNSPAMVHLQMFDITGKMINQIISEKTIANSFEFDMSNQAAGVYLLRIQVGNNSLVQRIIVKP